MINLANILLSDFKEDWSKPSIKFFRSHGAYGYVIWLTLIDAFFTQKKISVETLVITVENYASRRTVIDFIIKASNAKFLNRINSDEDKRKVIIEPSDITINEYKEWAIDFKKNIS